jgi:hypothetical protein
MKIDLPRENPLKIPGPTRVEKAVNQPAELILPAIEPTKSAKEMMK